MQRKTAIITFQTRGFHVGCSHLSARHVACPVDLKGALEATSIRSPSTWGVAAASALWRAKVSSQFLNPRLGSIMSVALLVKDDSLLKLLTKSPRDVGLLNHARPGFIRSIGIAPGRPA